jgi:hypothetical protein
MLPIQLYELDPVELEKYRSKSMDAFDYMDTIPEWIQKQPFVQQWQKTDTIHLQVRSNYAPLSLKLIGKKEEVFFQDNMTNILPDRYETGMYIYQKSIPLATIPEGGYYLQMDCGAPIALTLVSNVFCIKEKVENSLLLEYKHHRYYGDIVFETGFGSEIRVLGRNIFKTPASKDTFYEDQVLNMTLLNSVPYRLYDLVLSDSFGIPDFFIDKLNRILGCSTVLIDGVPFTKNDGAKLEEKAIEDYPLRGWSIEMREKLNRSSRFYENNQALEGVAAVVINVDSKGFGNDTGGTVYNLTDIN